MGVFDGVVCPSEIASVIRLVFQINSSLISLVAFSELLQQWLGEARPAPCIAECIASAQDQLVLSVEEWPPLPRQPGAVDTEFRHLRA